MSHQLPELMLIDGYYILHRALRVPDMAVMRSSTGFTTGGVFGFISSLRKSLEAYSSVRRVVVAWDTGRSPRREKILPSYKGTRDAKNAEDKRDQEIFRKLFAEQILLLKAGLFNMGVRQVALPKREGDDIIGLVCDLFPYVNKVVVSDDKDMIQLVDSSTKVFRPMAEQEVTHENFQEMTGTADRDRFLVSKAILGDSSDNIPGVPGVGKKTVQDLLEVVNARPNDPNRGITSFFMDACERMPTTKKGAMGARYHKVFNGGEDIKRNLDLVDISREVFSPEEENVVEFYVKGGRVTYTKEKVMRMFLDLEFNSMIQYFSAYDRLFGELS